MGIILLIILFGLILIGGLAFAIFGTKSDGDSIGGRVPGAIAASLAGLSLFLTLFIGGIQSVPVKSIGVPQAFGTISGQVMGPGLHFTWQPWMSVNAVNETVQTTSFEGANALPVRIGGQQSALADATIQWQILPQAAEGLYQDYANQGDLMQEITNAVVVREFKQVVNNEIGDYNPITDVQSVTNTPSATSQFTQLSGQIQQQMETDIGNRIKVISVFLPKLTYDTAVEHALQTIQTSYANYAIATENIQVNRQQAAALVKLGDPSLAQLAAQCLTDLDHGMQAPTGFQCIPGTTSNLSLTGK